MHSFINLMKGKCMHISFFLPTQSFSGESTQSSMHLAPSVSEGSSKATSGSLRVIRDAVPWMWSTLQITIPPHEVGKSTDCYLPGVSWGTSIKRGKWLTVFGRLQLWNFLQILSFLDPFFIITSCNLPLVAKASLPANSIVTLSAAAIINEFIPVVNLFSFMLFLLIQLLWLHHRTFACLHCLAFNDSLALPPIAEPIFLSIPPTLLTPLCPLLLVQLDDPEARRNQVSGAMDPTRLLLLIPLERDAKQAQDEANYGGTVSARSLMPVFKWLPLRKYGDCEAWNWPAS